MTTTQLHGTTTAPEKESGPHPLARRAVALAAGAPLLVLLIVSTRYGYQGDELYFLGAGKHLSWSYADQPVLLPLLAHGIDVLTGGSLFALRLLPALLTFAGAVVATLIRPGVRRPAPGPGAHRAVVRLRPRDPHQRDHAVVSDLARVPAPVLTVRVTGTAPFGGTPPAGTRPRPSET
ncbi:hypothetical protein SALBM311S_12107 [Streptomyces alboniger]